VVALKHIALEDGRPTTVVSRSTGTSYQEAWIQFSVNPFILKEYLFFDSACPSDLSVYIIKKLLWVLTS